MSELREKRERKPKRSERERVSRLHLGPNSNPTQASPNQVTRVKPKPKPNPSLEHLAKFAPHKHMHTHVNKPIQSNKPPNKNHTWFTQAKHRALIAPRADEQCR